jgi:nucleotide-binding universal stress UspA family protein
MPEKNVIVSTDGSDHSLRVVPHAALLAENLGAGLEFVRVVEKNEVSTEQNEDAAAAAERTRSRIEGEVRADLQQFGVTGDVHAVIADKDETPAQALMRRAADGLVLAMHSRGRGSLARILQGSVAMAVLKEISQPVMLGGPELLPPAPVSDTYPLLVTTDLSPDADQVLRAISPLLEMGKFQVTLLYVHFHAPGGVDNEAERAQRQAELEQKRTLLPASVPVEPVLREIPIGAGVDTAIMEVAQTAGARAIAMSTHGTSARHNLLMGSVAMSILGRSRLPLIVARV